MYSPAKNDQTLNILIVDDHHLLLQGTVDLVQNHYPAAHIRTAQTAQAALVNVAEQIPDLAIIDLSIPETAETAAAIETGLGLLQQLMTNYPLLNLMIQSSNVNALIRLMFEIDNHQGGFTIVDKSLPINTFLTRMAWSIEGLTHTKDLQTDLEVKPEWLEVLRLAFTEGMQDKGIARAMFKSERMIRHYWSKLQNALEVYPEDSKSMRILIQIKAREKGLID